MMNAEQKAYRKGIMLVDDILSQYNAEDGKKDTLSRIENRINDILEVLECKGIYPTVLYLADFCTKTDNNHKNIDGIVAANILKMLVFVPELRVSAPLDVARELVKLFEESQAKLPLRKIIYFKKLLESCLNYSLVYSRTRKEGIE